MKKYIARLTQEEREHLTKIVKKGKGMAYRIKHANIFANWYINFGINS